MKKQIYHQINNEIIRFNSIWCLAQNNCSLVLSQIAKAKTPKTLQDIFSHSVSFEIKITVGDIFTASIPVGVQGLYGVIRASAV
jgi:hypothetical protein